MKSYFLIVLLNLCSFHVLAKSVIVHDSGLTIPLTVYTDGESPPKEIPKPYSKAQLEKKLKNLFPLKTTIPMKNVARTTLPAQFKPLTYRAVALIGTGIKSQQWLNQRLATLQKLNATIIIIDAENHTIFSRFEHSLLKAGLKTIWAPSEPFEQLTNGYPVIIHNGEVYQ